jgi:peptidoglycan/LPS O-acetylase OafA/YrhL
MDRETSLYLDAIRFAAALAVFLDHFSSGRLTGGFLWQLAPFGSEAVNVFFVLSGFVIAYAVDTRETSPRSYAISRAARIYSVTLPALAATVILDAAGRALQPDLYPAFFGRPDSVGLPLQLLAGATFTNELWHAHITPGSMVAYWSLGFEVWYYTIFGVAVFAPPRWRLLGAALLLVLVGPDIAALFPLWLIGVAAYRLYVRWVPDRFLGQALFFGSLAAWLGYEAIGVLYGRLEYEPPWFLERGELPQDYLIGLLFAVNLVSFRAVVPFLGGALRAAAAPIRWAAGATFTLYLFHGPVMNCLRAILPWPSESGLTRVLLFVGTLAAVFAIASVTEKRKDAWRRAIASLWPQAVVPPSR